MSQAHIRYDHAVDWKDDHPLLGGNRGEFRIQDVQLCGDETYCMGEDGQN